MSLEVCFQLVRVMQDPNGELLLWAPQVARYMAIIAVPAPASGCASRTGREGLHPSRR